MTTIETTDSHATDDKALDIANTEQPDAPQEQQESEPDTSKPGREAAKYRRQLREAEAERDATMGRLNALRKQVIEESSSLTQPASLWLSGVAAGDFFDEDGRLDRDALRKAEVAAVASLGLKEKPKAPPVRGREGTNPSPGDYDTSTFESAFRPKRA